MRKNIFCICSLIVATLIFVPQVKASLHRLQMGFAYKSVDYTATSFNLYCNGILVHNIERYYREADFILDTNEIYLTFTMTHVYDDKPESSHSKPFYFTANKPFAPSAPQGFQIGTYLKKSHSVTLMSSVADTHKAYQLNTYAQKTPTQSGYFFERDFATISPFGDYTEKINVPIFGHLNFDSVSPKNRTSLTKYALLTINKPLIKNT